MARNSRLYSLDFLKFIAALMITNSHFQPLYEDVSPSLATFGVHGNALFFFVSGFLLMMGFEKKKSHGFLNWYKGRMRRLWPAVFIWMVVSAAVWKQTLTIGNLLLFDGYWFLQAIAVAYIVFYVLTRPMKLFWGGKIRQMQCLFVLSLMVSITYFFMMPMACGSPFHTSFHYVCHFSVMVMGGLCYLLRDKVKCSSIMRDMLWMIVSFIAYFVILKIGKGAMGIRYYSQITALIPLHTFVYYLYKVASYSWCDKAFHSLVLGRVMSWIAALTLEVYIVQFAFITNQFNSIFPLNVLLVFAIIVLAAYLLKVMTSLFLAVLSKEDLEWKEIVRL